MYRAAIILAQSAENITTSLYLSYFLKSERPREILLVGKDKERGAQQSLLLKQTVELFLAVLCSSNIKVVRNYTRKCGTLLQV